MPASRRAADEASTRCFCAALISGPQSRSCPACRPCAARSAPPPSHETVVDRALHQEPAACRAGLAGVLHDGLQDERGGALQVGIVEHDLRGLAAKFEHDLQRPVGGRLLDQRADFGAAGEGDEVDVAVGGQRGAGFLAEAGDDVERAIGQAGLPASSPKGSGVMQASSGRLQHRGVAHGERRRDRAAEHLRRVVPRHDVRRHAVRLAQDATWKSFRNGICSPWTLSAAPP